MTVVVQPNVIARDQPAGVQVGELTCDTRTGFERLRQAPRGFFRTGPYSLPLRWVRAHVEVARCSAVRVWHPLRNDLQLAARWEITSEQVWNDALNASNQSAAERKKLLSRCL
jgi:hypothetical protein